MSSPPFLEGERNYGHPTLPNPTTYYGTTDTPPCPEPTHVRRLPNGYVASWQEKSVKPC